MRTSLFIVAVENSGDQLGAGLIESLRQDRPDLHIDGIGGAAMAALGVSSDIDISALAVLGFIEGVKIYPLVLERVRQTVDLILARDADAVVLIDSWGFMIRVAKALKKAGFKGQIIKYVAPQVWAMREGRAKILAKYVDHLLTIHSFDAPYFERHGLPVHYIGNPVFETDYCSGDGAALRQTYGIAEAAPVVAVMFGSRLSEIQTLAKPFADAISRLRSVRPDICFFSPVSESIAVDVAAAAAADFRLQDIIFLPEARKFDVFACADVALACSGTVTTQLACAGVPTTVAYRLNGLTYIAAKYLYKPNYISIVNIAADHALMPEYVQGACTGENLAESVLKMLNDPEARAAARQALLDQTARMRSGRQDIERLGEGVPASNSIASIGSHARAAKAVLKITREAQEGLPIG